MRCTIIGLLATLAIGLSLNSAHADDVKVGKKKKILVITESKGFVHSVVNRQGKPQCLVEKVLTELGDKTADWKAVASQDPKKEITAETLKTFAAVFFYPAGPLPLSPQQKDDLLAFVRSG